MVIKPNIVFLRPQEGYRAGDITDMRVTAAVLEYLARRSKAGRITIAEGGTYRSVNDPAEDNVVRQNGARVSAVGFDWGTQEFPGWGGSIQQMLDRYSREFPEKKFDFVDLSYDTVRDDFRKSRRLEVPRTARGVGAFGERKDYFVTRTITGCDFLISVPVMKVHEQCGITACFKNYVGTAPREAYALNGAFANHYLHADHSLEGRIDSFICDLAAFHPPDYNVVDGIQGLQHGTHNLGRPDQTVRTNLVLAGEDTVACDALVAHLLGFNESDIDFLHMAAQRELGLMELHKIDVMGDDPAPYRRSWGKPKPWWGRANREWRVTADPAQDFRTWARHTIPSDTLHFPKFVNSLARPGTVYGASVKVIAEGHRKAYLWVGAQGRVTATLNGEHVVEEESRTRYRIGQFQKAVELKPGENLLVFRLEALTGQPDLSALLVGPRNDGDTVDGIRWSA